MKSEQLIQGIIILIGLGIGAYFSNISYLEHKKLGHSDLKAHTEMDHGLLDISNESIIPQIEDLQLLKDPMSGWNVYVKVNNFQFTPANASTKHQSGEGHAHLYINGQKIARLYSNWFHLPEFIKDKNEIRVTLNTNDHQTMAIGNQPIEKVITR